MGKIRTIPATLLGLLCVFLLTACGVWSEHPLSDEQTSELDERLIGWWEGVKDKPGDDPPPRLLVGRREGRQNTMEAAYLELDDERVVRVHRLLLYATKIGEHHYLSATGEEEKGFGLVHYVLPTPDTAHIHLLDEAYVKKAIQDGTVKGAIEEDKENEGLFDFESETVMLTAPTKELRAWIEKHHASCFASEDPAEFRRVKKKAASRGEAGDRPDEEDHAEGQEK